MYTYEIFFILVIVRPTARDEHLEKKLVVFRRKTLDDNDDDDDDDVERSKRRWQPTKDSRAKRENEILSISLFYILSFFSWVIYKVQQRL